MRNLKRRFERFTAIALAVLMVVTTVDLSTFAVSAAGEGSGTYCEHHTEHTPECGYTEGIEGSPCTHEHGEECYSEVTVCVHNHDESCGYVEGVEDSCTHICSLENGCIISTLNCTHEHDEACGYQAAVEGTPCIFECEECANTSNDGSDTVSGNEVSDETTECTCGTDTQQAYCEYCNAPYGELNPDVHYDIIALTMTTEELEDALLELLNSGETDISILLAENADEEMFTAINTALCSSTAANGSVNLTIAGVQVVTSGALGNGHPDPELNTAPVALKTLNFPDAVTLESCALCLPSVQAVYLPKVTEWEIWGIANGDNISTLVLTAPGTITANFTELRTNDIDLTLHCNKKNDVTNGTTWQGVTWKSISFDHKDSAHTTATNNGNGTHSFTCTVCNAVAIQECTDEYSVVENKITKKCTACGEKGYIIITAEGGIYDGTTAYGATVEKTGIFENEEVTVNYYQGDTLIGTDAPVDVGTYTAKITYEDVTASVTFTITITRAFEVTGGTEGVDYTYENGVLTINTSTALTIKNTDPSTPTTDRIEVADGVSANITLAGVNIDVSSQYDTAAFKIADYSAGNVTITLADNTTNTLKSGYNCAGLQKNGEYISADEGKLTITGTGSLTATGGACGAGIGGGYNGSADNIEISGGEVTATGGAGSAGIGGGSEDSGSNIKISGGTVTATGGTCGAGIGGGASGSADNIKISGGSVKAVAGEGFEYYGTTYSPAAIGQGVQWDSNTGVYSNGAEVTPTDGTDNVYLLELDVDGTSAVTANGKAYPTKHIDENWLYVYLPAGNYTVANGNSQKIYTIADDGDVSEVVVGTAFTITGTALVYGTDYTYPADTGVLTILSSKAVTIANTDPSTPTTNRIEVATGISANITLAGVNIDVSATENTAAFKIADDSTGNVTITLADGTTNTLKSGGNCAGLQKNGEYSETLGKLTITGTGSLTATGGDQGAGIGGGFSSGSNITISGGTITAIGGEDGAGIGGGFEGSGSNIKISGGVVTATGGDYGAGIGGGWYNSGSNIEISGGEVIATSGEGGTVIGGAGIGGGKSGSGSNIEISGGTVTATGDTGGAGIGGGETGSGSYITISGGTVTAEGGAGGAGIGGGNRGSADNITISGGTVKADTIGCTPTDGTDDANPVYLLQLPVDGTSAVTANGKAYPTKHFDENKVYIYLPAKTAQAPNEVTVGNETTKYCYINAKWLKVVDSPEADDYTEFTYDGTEKTYTLAESDYYTITGNKQTNAGTYTVTVALNDKDNTVWNDGSTEDKEYSFVIYKADSVLETVPTPKTGLTYKGEGQNLISAGTTTDGEMQYSLDGTNYSSAIPTGTDAGEYTVWYKVVGDENHNDTEPASIEVLIAPKSITVTADNASKTYGEDDPTFTYTATGLEGSDTLTGTLSRETGENVGTYAITQGTLTNENNPNYDITFVEGTFTINKATPPALTIPTATSITYGEKLSASTLSDGWAWVDGTIVPNAVANYNAYIEVDDSNYDYTDVDGYDDVNHRVVRDITVIITRATLTITANSYTIKVGDTLPTYAYDVTGLVNGDTLPFDVSLSCSATDSNTVGTYPITISGVASDALASLYAPIYENGKLIITEKEEQTITASDVTLTYGEKGKKITATTSGDGAISYSTTSDVISVAADGTITALKAGTATVTITAAETADYAEATKTISVTVNKVGAEVTAAPTPIADLEYDGTAQNLINAGTTTDGVMQYSLDGTNYSPTIPTGADAGKYTVWYKVVGDENHNDTTPASIEVTIAPKTLEIGTVTANDRVFDGTNTVEISEVIISGILNTDNVSASATATINSINAGVYSTVDLSGITLTGDAASNYSIAASAENVSLTTPVTISKAAAPTLPRGSKEYVYSISYEGESVSITGLPTDCGEVTYSLQSMSSDMLEIVSIDANGKITYNVKALDSYTEDLQGIISVNVMMENYKTAIYMLTITRTEKIPQNISAEDIILTYGDADATISVTGAKTELSYEVVEDSNDNGYVVTVDADGKVHIENAGTATIRITASSSDTYAAAACEITVTVEKANLTITFVEASDKIYDGSKKIKITAFVLNGIVNGDDVSVRLTGIGELYGTLESEHVGDYTSVQLPDENFILTGADADNYLLSVPEFAATNVTIEKAPIVADRVLGTLGAIERPYPNMQLPGTVDVASDLRYSISISWDPADEESGYNTVYTAKAYLTAEPNYTFAQDISLEDWEVVSNTGAVLVVKRTFEATDKACIVAIDSFGWWELEKLYENTEDVIADLPDTILVYTEKDPDGLEMPITWSCESYDNSYEAENIFIWTIVPEAYADYDTNGFELSGELLVINPIDPVEQFVRRLYGQFLDREADEEGLRTWVTYLRDGEMDAATVVEKFVLSDEFVNSEIGDEEYVYILYNAILDREPEADGFTFWMNALEAGMTRQEVLAGFTHSIEFDGLCDDYGVTAVFGREEQVSRFVERMYTIVLSRPAEPEGLAYWKAGLLDGSLTGSQMAKGFLYSEEFIGRNTSDEEYIKILYRAFLDREAEDAGLAYWNEKIQQGMSRDEVLGGFIYSVEFSNICAEYGINAGTLE